MSRHLSNKRKYGLWVTPPILLTDWGMERMQSKTGRNSPARGDDAACTRLIWCEVLNLNVPALGDTTIPGYVGFTLEMEETFPTISIREAKNSRNKLFCQSNNFYIYLLGVHALDILSLPPIL